MKKLILFASLINGLFLQAQIVNPSFESVTASKPDDWNTAANNFATYYIRDTNDAQAGVHAAYIKGFGGQPYAVQGAVLGTFTMSTRPVAVTGWYKCNIVPNDSLIFYVNMYQSPVLTGAVANGYTFATTSQLTYKQFTATINYNSFPPGNVGSCYVGIYFSGTNVDMTNTLIPQTGTWAMIDNLALLEPPPPTTTYVAIQENVLNVNVEQIFPQPSTETTFLIYTLRENSTCDLQVMDVTGKEIKTVFTGEKQSPGRYKAEVDVSDLAPGVYFTRLRSGNETRVSKIIKQ